jgi:ketosteroid isomerase-like protein
MTTTPTNEDAPIREWLDAWARALRAKDVAGLMALYAPHVVTFDLTPPLQVHVDSYRKNFERWFASVQGPIGYETRDVHVAMSGDLAFCHYLSHVESTRATGERADYWVRVTSCFQKLGGRWLVSHEHVSMPLEIETMQAARDLQP